MHRRSGRKRRGLLLGEPRFAVWRPRLPVTVLEKKRLAKPANPQGCSHQGVPWGAYCGDCPYYGWIQHENWMRRGYCRLLNLGEWQRPAFGLLSDGVKRCWIRTDDGPDEVRQVRFVERPRMHETYENVRVWSKALRRGARRFSLKGAAFDALHLMPRRRRGTSPSG